MDAIFCHDQSRTLTPPYTMPLSGIHYFLENPSLWPYLISVLIPFYTLYLIVGICLFVPFFVLNLALFGVPGTVFGTVNFVHQVDTISLIVGEKLLFGMPLQFLFEAVLAREGCEEVVLRGKACFRKTGELNLFQKFKEFITFRLPDALFFYTSEISRIMTLVFLMLLPLAGPIITCFFNAPETATRSHVRYYELKGFTRQKRFDYFRERQDEYLTFGIVANFLTLIPVFSLFFTFTTTVAGALWAAQIETDLKRQNIRNITYNKAKSVS